MRPVTRFIDSYQRRACRGSVWKCPLWWIHAITFLKHTVVFYTALSLFTLNALWEIAAGVLALKQGFAQRTHTPHRIFLLWVGVLDSDCNYESHCRGLELDMDSDILDSNTVKFMSCVTRKIKVTKLNLDKTLINVSHSNSLWSFAKTRPLH